MPAGSRTVPERSWLYSVTGVPALLSEQPMNVTLVVATVPVRRTMVDGSAVKSRPTSAPVTANAVGVNITLPLTLIAVPVKLTVDGELSTTLPPPTVTCDPVITTPVDDSSREAPGAVMSTSEAAADTVPLARMDTAPPAANVRAEALTATPESLTATLVARRRLQRHGPVGDALDDEVAARPVV